ncbi:hypothetical protein [Paraburkholderia humisilvae]|uniref:hypothetical protein n=1 Tax=Paraburkholderia humisilvae TaxID=627669 RepID=UPI001C2E553D|nr:hypothetical protein [Paraburkholderia humisilvae]
MMHPLMAVYKRTRLQPFAFSNARSSVVLAPDVHAHFLHNGKQQTNDKLEIALARLHQTRDNGPEFHWASLTCAQAVNETGVFTLT